MIKLNTKKSALSGIKEELVGDDDDAKAVLLSSMPLSFDHIVLNKMNPILEIVIYSLIDEGSRVHKSHHITEGCAY